VKATFYFISNDVFIPGRPFSPGSSAKMNPTASLEVSGPGQERKKWQASNSTRPQLGKKEVLVSKDVARIKNLKM
jgi:hypothetical protein